MNQSDHIYEQVHLAATGNREAVTELILTHGPGLRLMLAAHVASFAAIAPLELRVWVSAYGCLGDYDAAYPFSDWLFAIAMAPLTEHLQEAAARARVVQEVTTQYLTQDSLAALSDGSELPVLTLAALRDSLPEPTRALLEARYHERHSLHLIAARQGIDEPTLANALVAARARCDWRGVAKPPASSDRDLPPLIEDLLGGGIDNASRGLMADYLARDPQNVQQVARQVRVQVALRALFMPFARAHAEVLARQVQSGNAHAGHVVITAPVHIPVIPRPAGNETFRTPRTLSAAPASPTSRHSASSSHLSSARASKELKESQQDPDDVAEEKKPRRRTSPLPYLIAGVLVLGGVIGVLASSRSNAAPSAATTRTEPTALLPVPEHPPAEVVRPPAGEPGALRPLPAPSPKVATAPLQVTLVGVVADSHPYAGRELVLRSVLSSAADIARVEYWNAETKLGEATTAPWTFAWTPTAGALALSARAVTQAGDLTKSPEIALSAVTTYGSGGLRREWWTGIPGEKLKGLDQIVGFPARPQGHALVEQFASPSNWGDDFVQRVWGFLIPPLDGDYVFWVAADDEAELWLSSDDTVQTRQRIAVSKQISGSGTKLMQWDRQPAQRSSPLRLQAGRRYLIEVLHKEGRADDHVEVGWRLPDGALERPIPGIHLSPPVVDPGSGTTAPVAVPPLATTPPPAPTWTVVRAINLGGDSVEIDGVRWLGHRQAEADGATPVNSHRPGPWLSDLPWTRGTNGNGPVRRDRSTTERSLTVDGKVYAKGLGVHATSEVIYALEAQWTSFSALVGVDDAADGAKAEVVFQVWLDGQKVWDSGPVRKGTAKPVAVPLVGRKELRLVVEPSGPGDWDHADWANAQFMRVGGGDGTLQVKTGKRSTASYTPKPAVDAKMRSVLTTALSGTSKDGLEFSVRVPNGPLRVWLLMGESGTTNSRQFELDVDGTALPPMNGMPASSWQKIGPVELLVKDELVTVKATPTKGVPQVMGFLAERPEISLSAPLLSPSDPLAVIQDAIGFRQIYQVDLAKVGQEVPYEVDNTALFSGKFTRVAYLLELQKADKPLQWVWTSMDAFTAEVRLIGVPTAKSGAFFQQKVVNLLVASNVDGLPVGMVGDGVIEFFSSDYGGNNQAGIVGATDALDFGDQPSAQKSEGYGCMQVHNLGAKQTVWALNHWVVGNKADLGIGPSPSGGDWTYANNADGYVLKRLRAFVKSAP